MKRVGHKDLALHNSRFLVKNLLRFVTYFRCERCFELNANSGSCVRCKKEFDSNKDIWTIFLKTGNIEIICSKCKTLHQTPGFNEILNKIHKNKENFKLEKKFLNQDSKEGTPKINSSVTHSKCSEKLIRSSIYKPTSENILTNDPSYQNKPLVAAKTGETPNSKICTDYITENSKNPGE